MTRLADRGSELSLESRTATASGHDGLIGGQQNPGGSVACWTQSPGMTERGLHGLAVDLERGLR